MDMLSCALPQLATVDRTLHLFKGNEREMWALLRDKYPKAFKADARLKKTSKVVPDVEAGGMSAADMMGTRLDLDDLGGEICLLDWGDARTVGPPSCATNSAALHQEAIMGGKATVTLCQESFHTFGTVASRVVHVEEDERVLPLPETVKYDAVGADLNGIPRACSKIQRDWNSGASPNRITAWYFGRELHERLRAQTGVLTVKPNRVDLLITGCEVSLWVAEQFAADLALVFPTLVVRALSANKVLGLKGQSLPMQATGFGFTEDAWDLTGAMVLIVSHSGGTFAPLAVSNLLQSEGMSIFVATSEWDTQIGKQLRQIGKKQNAQRLMKCRIFSTDIGMHPAEPSTISVAATHQLLTQLLVYLMDNVLAHKAMGRFGATYLADDVAQLEANNQATIGCLEQIVGVDRDGITLNKSALSQELRAKGHLWAQHVLEAPRAWALCAIYILGTVTFQCPLFFELATLAQRLGATGIDPTALWVSILDACFYLWTPQIFTTLIRVVQGRPLGHRIAGRSVVIGDVPWVSQCVEAMASKLFAITYSNTGVSFYSANPADHLVHRFTHRVVRGALLAVGRPDGRLASLASTEASVCLSVNQASSIQNMGVCLESLTLGHNPSKLPLSSHAVYLPSCRPDYLGEREVKKYDLNYDGAGKSAGALLGDFENLWKRSEQAEHDRRAKEAAGKKGKRRESVAGERLGRVKTLGGAEREHLGVVEASNEKYFGENLELANPGTPIHTLVEKQRLSERLYENRCASLQRLVSFFVLFHQMGLDVMQFWSRCSGGLLAYDMDRTHSIMRIATTASPVSGAALRQRMRELERELRLKRANTVVRNMVRERLYGRRDVLGLDESAAQLTPEEEAAREAEAAATARVHELKQMMENAQNEIAKALSDASEAKARADEESKVAKKLRREDVLAKRQVAKGGKTQIPHNVKAAISEGGEDDEDDEGGEQQQQQQQQLAPLRQMSARSQLFAMNGPVDPKVKPETKSHLTGLPPLASLKAADAELLI